MLRPTRFAHTEGHTDICYSDDGRSIITCGQDGEVRIFQGLDDDDCVSHAIADEVYCVAYMNENIIVGTDLNIVQQYTIDEGKHNGIITRCTDFPTHIDVSHDRKFVAVASSDMTVKVHDCDNFQDKIFSGHSAPVLSVALDPKRDFVASSSCDGTVRIWNFRTQTMVRSFPLLSKTNDFITAPTLCRMTWSRDGQYVYIPVESKILVYNRTGWQVDFSLTDSSITGVASVTAVSPCGKFLAVGCRDGRIAVFDIEKRACVVSQKAERAMGISALAWHPKSKPEIAFVNLRGEFGTLEKFLTDGKSNEKAVEKENKEDKLKLLPDNTEVGVFDSEDIFPPPEMDFPDEDDNEISLAQIKSQLGFADDPEGTYLGPPKDNAEPSISRPESRLDMPESIPAVVPTLPEPQKPFQPGMSPDHLNDRYMVWNSTGIVRQFESNEERSIEVEFHDSSVHHPLHLSNHAGHSVAALSHEVLALAAESQDDQCSKLLVHHLTASDGAKEWRVDLPEGEDSLALAVGAGWVAMATDLRNLRIFSSSGTQMEVLTIPGPVVCMSGFEQQLFVVYHSGIGVLGEQAMSAFTLSVNGSSSYLASPTPLPLSPKAFLSWAGFSDEGTPMIVDSVGVVRVVGRKGGKEVTWAPVLNTKSHTKGKSDHYFFVGASESQSCIRAILCKGVRYPPVLPRPHVTLLEFKIPVCEPESEKGALEERLLRSLLLHSTLEVTASQGKDVEQHEAVNLKALKETTLKLFALACRSERDSRALSVCDLMPSIDMVEAAIRFAARSNRGQLAQRLNEVVEKRTLDQQSQEEEKREFFIDSQRDLFEEPVRSCSPLTACTPNAEMDEEKEGEDVKKRNPLLAASEQKMAPNKSRFQVTPGTRNPFKRTPSASFSSKGIQAIDSLKVTKKDDQFPILKPVIKKPKARLSTTSSSKRNDTPPVQFYTDSADKENVTSNSVDPKAPTSISSSKKTSALKLWLEDHRKDLEEKFGELNEIQLLVKAAAAFKDEQDDVKQKYKSMATEFNLSESSSTPTPPSSDDKKRKPEASCDEENENNEQPLPKKRSIGAKLSGFAFMKKDS